MRAAAVLAIALATVGSLAAARADPLFVCAAASECEQACKKGQAAACTHAAELYFDGKNGLAVDRVRSFALARRACDGGDAFGCAMLGSHYQDGVGTAWAPKLALAAYDKACRGGAGVGCYNLSTMYYGAHGVELDQAKGDTYKKLAQAAWQKACDGDGVRWCTNVGFLLADSDPARALKLDERACAAGVEIGCVEAARFGLLGHSLAPDAFLAEVERACQAGEPYGCTLGAAFLLSGENGVTPDARRAIELLHRACDNGDPEGCTNLALESIGGKNTPKDFDGATRYFMMACDRSKSLACVAIAENLAAIGKDLKQAFALAVRACHMGSAEGCGMVSAVDFQDRNEREGIAYATDGCRMGDGESCQALVLRDVELPAIPPVHAKKFYDAACGSGHPIACKRAAKLAPK